MGRASGAQLAASEQARSRRHPGMITLDPGECTQTTFSPSLDHAEIVEEDLTTWSGGVNHFSSDDDWSDDDVLESDDDIKEITSQEIIQNTCLQQHFEPSQPPLL